MIKLKTVSVNIITTTFVLGVFGGVVWAEDYLSSLNVLGKSTLDLDKGNVIEESLVVKSGGDQLKIFDVDNDHLTIGHNGDSGYIKDQTGSDTTGAYLSLGHDGKIGINTFYPKQSLDIKGTNTKIFMTDSTGLGTQSIIADGNLSLTAEASVVSLIADVNGGATPGSSSQIRFGAGADEYSTSGDEVLYPAVEWMRIINGNVGIGVISPDQRLDVDGNIKLSGDIVSNGDICIGICE